MFNQIESNVFSNISATPAAFKLRGGNYGITVHADTWGGGSVTLQRLCPKAATYVTVVTAFAADGYASANLPSGTYQLTIATSTGIYADVVSIVTSQ